MAHLEEMSDTGWVDELILQVAHLMSQVMRLTCYEIRAFTLLHVLN